MKRAGAIAKRTVISFYNDQMTQHAAALTYYALMSLFPAALLALSLMGIFGQYPATYDAIVGYLRDVVPSSALVPLDRSLRGALRSQGTAIDGARRSASPSPCMGRRARWKRRAARSTSCSRPTAAAASCGARRSTWHRRSC